MMGCDYNGWTDLPEDEREAIEVALDQQISAQTAGVNARRRASDERRASGMLVVRRRAA